MPLITRDPVTKDDQPYELSSYGLLASSIVSSNTHPLLDEEDVSFRAPSPLSTAKRRGLTVSRQAMRWLRPLTLLIIPLILVIITTFHPDVRLPRIVIQYPSTLETTYPEDSECTCPNTREGGRLCSVYRPETLRSTQLVRGTGARMRRMLQKAKDGKPLKVGLLGGSGKLLSLDSTFS